MASTRLQKTTDGRWMRMSSRTAQGSFQDGVQMSQCHASKPNSPNIHDMHVFTEKNVHIDRSPHVNTRIFYSIIFFYHDHVHKKWAEATGYCWCTGRWAHSHNCYHILAWVRATHAPCLLLFICWARAVHIPYSSQANEHGRPGKIWHPYLSWPLYHS